MFTTGMNPNVGKYFSIATVVITAPFAVIGVNLLASLWRAKLRPATPMLFCLGVISAVGFGGFGGLFLGTMVSDIYFHETYFVVGHFHLMIGTVTLLGIFAAMYFWYPKLFGRKMSEKLGQWHFWLTAVPMCCIFLLMHVQGLGGMLRRTYDPSMYDYNAPMNSALRFPITTFAFIVFCAQLIFFWNFFRSMKKGEIAGDNPWESSTLEWTTPSPAGHGNWPGALPVVTVDPYEYGDEHPGGFLPQGTVPSGETAGETASEGGEHA